MKIFLLFLALLVIISRCSFDCPSSGYFANPNFNECDTFYQCDKSENATLIHCPWPLVWHDDVKGCYERREFDCSPSNSLSVNWR